MKHSWHEELAEMLSTVQQVCIVGIGNRQKGDDAAGVICAEMLTASFNNEPNLKVIVAEEVPENYTGEIRKFKPTHTVIIDSTIAGKKPGTVFLVEAEKIADTDFSTHRMPLSMLVKFLEESIGCKTVIIGIEPKCLDWNSPVSAPVQKAVTAVVAYLTNLLVSPKPHQ